jgi:hypothetical protein
VTPSDESHSDRSHDRPIPGKRRTREAHPPLRSTRSRTRDACQEPLSSDRKDDRYARPAYDSHTELEEFARWFADWWLRRGRELTRTTTEGGPDE